MVCRWILDIPASFIRFIAGRAFQYRPHAEDQLLVIISVPSVIMHRIGEDLFRPTENIGLIVEQGRKGFYHINIGSDHPLAAAKKNPAMYKSSPSTSFLYCTQLFPPGVAALFVLLFVILTVQMYWVCELTYPGWKEVPGAACVLPEAVAITQVVGRLPPSLAHLSVCS